MAYLTILEAKIAIKHSSGEGCISPLIAAFSLAKSRNHIKLQKESAELLAIIYRLNKNYKNALQEQTLFYQLQDSIESAEMKIKIRNLEIAKETELLEKDQLLEKSILERSLEKQTLIKKGLLFPLIILSLFSLFILGLYKATNKTKSELESKNQALLKTESILEQKNRDLQKYIDHNIELEQFAHIASHDIKSPLRTISAFAGLLRIQLYKNCTDKQKEQFNYIQSGVQRLGVLVDDLLQFSVANSQELRISDFSSQEVFDTVLENLDFDIRASAATITMKNCDSVIKADKIKLKQIIQNLLSNAIKFRDSERALAITLSCEEKKDSFLFTIDDNGIGITEQYKEKIFERFTQLNSKDQYEGSGLGLALCQKYVIKHKGNIWLAPKDSPGSTFKFSISKNLR